MQWLLTSHVRRYHRHYHGSGHVWQGRFKAFPIEQDEHLHTVLRYVERNPLRAKLVRRAEAWAWSSLAWRPGGKRPELLADWPVPCPRAWCTSVNAVQTEAELAALRHSVARCAIWRGTLEPADRRTPGDRSFSPAPWPPEET